MQRIMYLSRWIGNGVAALSLLCLLVISSCNDDEPAPNPVTVEFAETVKTINENGGAQTVTINFSEDANRDGSLTLSVTSANAAEFINIPSTVNISAGNSFAQITVTPVNNATIDGARQATITLTDPSTGYIVGTKSAIQLNVVDDEGEVTANFSTNYAEIAENNTTGIDIEIMLSDAADVAGTIVISVPAEDAPYITSVPAVSGNTITIPVAAGATAASFKITPVNDAIDNDDYTINLVMSNATGGVTVGTLTDFTLVITDDDDTQLTTIASIRSAFSSGESVVGNYYINGVVTSAIENTTSQSVYIQDATAGIVLRFTTGNSTLQLGDSIKALVKNRTLGTFQGLLQIEGMTYDDMIEKLATGKTIVPQVITIAQANSGTYQSMVVKFNDVHFKEANGIKTYGGNNTISNGTDEIITFVRTSTPQASFKDVITPGGIGSITGVMTTFGVSETPQLLLRSTSDVNLSFVGTMTVTGTIEDFGNVNNGANSTNDSFELSATGLVNNVTITAPSNFEVSSNGTDFLSSLSLDYTSVNASPVTIYVRFSPSSGVNGLKEGVLTISSVGAETKTISLSGSETGNVAASGTLMLYEVYGGGGNSGATYNNDYVVLYNGTSNTIDLTGYSLHYSSATGSFGTTNNANLSGSILPGDYFLVQLAAGTTVTDKPLPTPDLVAVLHGNASASINMAGASGKIALVHAAANVAISGKNDANVIDFVGYGSANDFEGTAAAGGLSNSTSAKRKSFVDSNDNSLDFEVVTPNLSYIN